MFNVANKNVLSSTGIAILASLGIHGLLWAVLPGLTVSQADKSPSERTINLIELSPQEQSRLPQVSNPADNTLPAFASQLTALPPLPPAPPYQTSVIPPVQLSPGSALINNASPNQNSAPPLQTFQVPLPPPPQTSFPAIPYENIPNSNPLPPIPQAPPFVLPPNNGLPDAPLTPDRTLPADEEIARATPSPEPTQPSQANLIAPAAKPPEAAKLPERGKKELLAMRDSMRNNFPQQVVTPASINTRALSRPEIAAALRGQQSRNQPASPNTRALSRSEIAAALRGQNRNLSNERSQELSIEQDNLDKYTVARAEVQKKYPGVGTKQIRRKLISCDRALDDLAVVSVVVNPQGKRLSEPVLITQPRRENLTLAQNDVRNYGFTKTGKTTNYIFRLEFDYIASKCAQAKPTPTPTPDSKPAPNLSPALSSPKPTPIPDSKPAPNLSPALSSPKPTPIPDSKPAPNLSPALSSPKPTPSPDSTPAPNLSPEPTSTPLPLNPNKPSF
ncbi:hypothetical protein [Chlorogloea sp. CCALA 695]|uniref:hypothetical protein n=1 Tax=Chlorogloea sp. CCALA 695 TaxID=2107693 RepID=UPI000D053D8E|nr:hypothetical protein [Chlorogloea sp. CCALA 695]PSB34984.1 hypothetical protein C7B70_01610 [Chlorogloea sp. CCALA 695]